MRKPFLAVTLVSVLLLGCARLTAVDPSNLRSKPLVVIVDPATVEPQPAADPKGPPRVQEPAVTPAPVPPAPVAERPKPVGYAADSAPAVSVEHTIGPGRKLRIDPSEGTMPAVTRTVRLLAEVAGEWRELSAVTLPTLIGNALTVTEEQRPGEQPYYLITAERDYGVRHGAVRVEGAGSDQRLVALDYYRMIAPEPELKTGTFLYLNKWENQVWGWSNGILVFSAVTANGRDPWYTTPVSYQNVKEHFGTPEGLWTIKTKLVNPAYNNFSGRNKPFPGGHPQNPLGTRWIGFEVLQGDGGGIWAFHGTAYPEQLGTWASEGCIRMSNADVEALYQLVPPGTKVRIVRGK